MNKKFRTPIYASVDITNKCNLNCIHCRNDKSKFIDVEYNKLDGILTELEEMEVFFLSIVGGEPFLYKDIDRLLIKLNNLNIPKITIVTNGTMINIKQIIKLNPHKIKFIISLDGPESIHNFIRGKNIYTDVLKSIKLLIDNHFSVAINYTIMKPNFKHIREIIEVAKKLKINKINFLKLFPVHSEIYSLMLSKEETEELYRTYDQYKNDNKIKLSFEKDYLDYPEYIDDDVCFSVGCRAGISQINILSNGDVVGCKLLPQIISGNIYKDRLIDIWNNDSAWELYRKIDENIKDDICKDCKYFSACRGGCRALSFYVNNDLYGKDPNCTIR